MATEIKHFLQFNGPENDTQSLMTFLVGDDENIDFLDFNKVRPLPKEYLSAPTDYPIQNGKTKEEFESEWNRVHQQLERLYKKYGFAFASHWKITYWGCEEGGYDLQIYKDKNLVVFYSKHFPATQLVLKLSQLFPDVEIAYLNWELTNHYMNMYMICNGYLKHEKHCSVFWDQDIREDELEQTTDNINFLMHKYLNNRS